MSFYWIYYRANVDLATLLSESNPDDENEDLDTVLNRDAENNDSKTLEAI